MSNDEHKTQHARKYGNHGYLRKEVTKELVDVLVVERQAFIHQHSVNVVDEVVAGTQQTDEILVHLQTQV